jgi:hypothetical protein
LLPIGRIKVKEGLFTFTLLTAGLCRDKGGSTRFGLLPTGRSKLKEASSSFGLLSAGLGTPRGCWALTGLLTASSVVEALSCLLASMNSFKITSNLSFLLATSLSTSRDDASGSDFFSSI